MRFFKNFLKAANGILTVAVAALLLLAGVYSVYSIWDNSTVYAEVDEAMAGLMEHKPETEGDIEASFEELRAINKDVCAWLTLDGTKIDYPIVQGENNLTYINKNIYGEFALSGSIYLDSYCDSSFASQYSLLYGHHMAERKMFGDLDLYREKAFFDNNTTGTLTLPDKTYRLDIFACIEVSASDEYIFYTSRWKDDNSGLLDYVLTNDGLINSRVPILTDGSGILAMSTCSSDYTDARLVLLAVMIPNP